MTGTRIVRKGNAWRFASAIASLGLFAWGLAALAYFDATDAKAEDTETFRDVDLVFDVYQDGNWYTVSIAFFMYDNGDGTFDEQADQARTDMLARFPNAQQPADDHMTAAYVISGFKWMTGNTTWAYNAEGQPGGLSAASAMQSAAATWGQQGANFSFTGLGSTTAGTGACGDGTDGSNTVGWNAQSGSVLAVTCSWYETKGNPRTAIEFDMEFDPDWNWSTGSPTQLDFESVALHEFGHALGLNHSDSASAVMYATYSSGSNKRTPTQDDKDGLIAIYGALGGEATNTPTSTPQATSTPTKTPTQASGQSPTPTAPLPTSTPTKTPTSGGGGQATATPPLSTSTPTATPTQLGAGGGSNPTPPMATSTATKTPSPTPTVAATATPTTTPTSGNSLPVLPGANLFAWPGDDAAPSQVLAGVANLKIVYSYEPLTGHWRRYVPGAPAYLNNLDVLKKGGSYWFIATGSAQVPFQ